MLTVLLLLLAFTAPERALASITVTRTSSNAFYTDLGKALESAYASYQVTNSDGVDYADMWVTIGDFAGGSVGLSTGAPGTYQIGAITNGQTKPAFFFLKASALTVTAQTHNIKVYNGNPTKGGVLLQTTPFSLAGVSDLIQANANRVTGGTVVPPAVNIGQVITVTLTGKTGTIGAAKLLTFTPAAKATWNAKSFKMVTSAITLSGANTGTYTNQLQIPVASITSTADTDYEAVYTFVAENTTTTSTPIFPIGYISSGTQIKHTTIDDATYQALPPVPAITNGLVITVTAAPSTQAPGATVTYTVTATNTGSQAASLSWFGITLATNFTYVSGSSQFNGAAEANPTINGQVLLYTGPYSVPAGGSSKLVFQATVPNTTGTYATSAAVISQLSSPDVQIDSTADTNDNAPATASVTVANLPPPTLTSINPNVAAVGTNVTLVGTGFTGATTVTFNGTPASFVVNSDTSITATVPNGATSGNVVVTNAVGSASKAFTVIPAPTITNFNPTSGVVGTPVTITGTNFTNASSVTFGGQVVTAYTVVDDGSITTTVPAGAATGKVTVTTPGGTATSAANFTVTGAPTIDSFTPTSGVPGTVVTITGTNLLNATDVHFGTVDVITFTVDSDTQITATVPFGAITGKISATTPNGTGSSATNFTVPPPTISSFTPTSGLPSTAVTIYGQYFTGAGAVVFNGTPVTTFSVVDDGTITTTVPAGATSGAIQVTTPAGTATSGSVFSVPPPAINSFTPLSGIVGDTVVLTGNHFTGATAVTFGGVNAPTYSVDSDTQITVKVPNGAASGPITVTGPGGVGTSNVSYAVIGNPTIISFTPGSGLPDSTVTITGTDFTGAKALTIGGVTITTFTVNSNTQITATIPNNAVSGVFEVTGLNDGKAVSANTYTVLGLPTVTAFTPTSGGPTTAVIVTGTNFTNVSGVTIGGQAVGGYNVVNDTTISLIVGQAAVTGPIAVTTNAGTGTSANNFTVTHAPTITSFTPNGGGPGTPVTITGTNFTGATSVTIGGVAVTGFLVMNDSTITLTLGTVNTGAVVVTTPNGRATSATQFTFSAVGATVVVTGSGAATLTNGSGTVGSMTIQNTGTTTQTLNTVTVVFSDPTSFSSATITASAGGNSVSATAVPQSSTLFTFSPPLTLQPGQVATLVVDLTTTGGYTRSAMKSAPFLACGLPLLLTLLALPFMPGGLRRRGLQFVLTVALASSLAFTLAGCGGGGGGTDGRSTGIYGGPVPRDSTLSVTRITGTDSNGQTVDYQGLPVQVAAVRIVN